MARGRGSKEPARRDSKGFDPEEAAHAKERLEARIRELRELNPSQPEFIEKANMLLETGISTVRDVFGQQSDEAVLFDEAVRDVSGTITRGYFDDHDPFEEARAEREQRELAVRRAIPRLENLIRLVDEKTVAAVRSQMMPIAASTSRRVFVVHGHRAAVKQEVARTLERLELEPIILHEWADEGRTVIEKLEAYTDVAYAVVLMTGDDMGGPKGSDPASYKLRARQNVLVELGVFLAKLGRSRVAILYEPGVEMPSDYSGVLFKPLDVAGAWRWELAKEIKAAGIPVDLNKL